MDNFVEIDYDEWFNTYKPILNRIDTNASFDGHMFETYGEELDFVRVAPHDHIWTYGDGDDGGTYVWNGFSIVNRIGYFITEVPCPENTTMQIQIAEPDLTCDLCDDTIDTDQEHKCEG